MIVESMTPTEVFEEIGKDLDGVHKSIERLKREYHKTRLKLKINKERKYPRVYEIKSKRKNPWIIILSNLENGDRYKDLNNIHLLLYTYHYRKRGLRVFRINTSTGLSVYSGHVFTRYNERMDLKIVDSLDIVKTFFLENQLLIGEIQENSKVIVTCFDGLLLGRRTKGGWIIYNTFIGENEIKENQEIDRDKRVDDVLLEINRFKMNRDSYIYLKNHKPSQLDNLYVEG